MDKVRELAHRWSGDTPGFAAACLIQWPVVEACLFARGWQASTIMDFFLNCHRTAKTKRPL